MCKIMLTKIRHLDPSNIFVSAPGILGNISIYLWTCETFILDSSAVRTKQIVLLNHIIDVLQIPACRLIIFVVCDSSPIENAVLIICQLYKVFAQTL